MSDKTFKIQPCVKCNQDTWYPMPDSLALFCTNCGEVIVNIAPGKYERGASIQEWVGDLVKRNNAL